MNRTKAIAVMSAGLLSFSLSACGGPELTESEVLDPTKHVKWAADALLPEWGDGANMQISPLAAVPAAARDLPETYSIGEVSGGLTMDGLANVPARLATQSESQGTRVLDLQTGAVYDISAFEANLTLDGVSAESSMLTVSNEGRSYSAGMMKVVEYAQGLQGRRNHMGTILEDFASLDDPISSRVDPKIVDSDQAFLLAANTEKIFIAEVSVTESNQQMDVVAVDVLTGQETGYEHVETYDFFQVVAQAGEPVIYYATKEGEVRGRNLDSGADFEVRANFLPGVALRLGDDALIIGRDKAGYEECKGAKGSRCPATILRVNDGRVTQEVNFDTERHDKAPRVRRSGETITLTFNDEEIVVLDLNAGAVLLDLTKDDLRELNIDDAISDGETIYTRSGKKVAQSDLRTRQLVNADVDVYPLDSASGARVWGVRKDDSNSYEARVAVEDLDKF